MFGSKNITWVIIVGGVVILSALATSYTVFIAKLVGPIVGLIIFLLLSVVGSSIGIMGAANTVFKFKENVVNHLLDGESTESTKIGGPNVSNREEFVNRHLSRLQGWYTVIEEDSWEIHPQNTIADDPKFLLYVLVAKVACKNNSRESARVSLDELEREVETRFPADPFVRKSQRYLIVNYDPEEDWIGHNIEKHEAKVEFDFDAIEEGVDWIIEGSRDPPRNEG